MMRTTSPPLDLAAPGPPKHRRLRDYLLAEVAGGRLRAGDALPSEPDLAARVGVARGTVRQALAALEREGLVRRVHGKGTFIRDVPAPGRPAAALALVVPDPHAGFYPALLRGFEEAASRRRQPVVVVNSRNDLDAQGHAVLQLIDRQAGGVALVPTTDPPTPAFHARQLQAHGIPVVCCHRPVEGVAAPLLALPYAGAGRLAGEAAARAGHRAAGFVCPQPAPAGRVLEDAFRAALPAGGLPADAVCYGRLARWPAAEAEAWLAGELDRLLAPPRPATVLFVTFEPLAELAYLLLVQRGLRVPGDVSLVTFGGADRDGAIRSRLSAVTVDEADTGRRAAELLGLMARGELAVDHEETFVLPAGWAGGGSLGPPA